MAILELKDVTKKFGGLTAVDGVILLIVILRFPGGL